MVAVSNIRHSEGDGMTTEAQKRAVAKYDAKNTRKIVLKLNTGTDADILERLDTVDNRQGYIKRLIREDIGKDDTL
jgi:hypothetical protein